MKIKLISCGICEHWHAPQAHNNHCPACGSYRIIVRRRAMYFNWCSEREVIRTGLPIILKRLLMTANEGSEA
jgi:hypothetical protein